MYDKEEATAQLREWLKPGDTVYTIMRNRSRSGMSRVIGVVIFKDGQPLHPNASISTVLGLKWDRQREGIKIGGCGMDMGFEIVYNLGRVLWPKGICKGEKKGRRAAHAIHSDNGPACELTDGGYALRHQWL
jgi:hypothetical protein